MLKPFGIPPKKESKNIRSGEKVLKGYHAKWFAESFERYLPQDPTSEPLQPLQGEDTKDLGRFSEALQNGGVADEKDGLSNGKQKDVAGVADQT